MTIRRYSSKAQEHYFQPRRVRILTDYESRGYGYSRSQRPVHYVIVQDVVAHEIVERYVREWTTEDGSIIRWATEAEWAARPNANVYSVTGGKRSVGDMIMRRDLTKADAVRAAKDKAVRGALPFDLKADVMDWDDAVDGEPQPCPICGDHDDRSPRGWYPTPCAQCVKHAEIGRLTEQVEQRGPVMIYIENVLSRDAYAGARFDGYKRQAELTLALLALAGVELEPYDRRTRVSGDRAIIGKGWEKHRQRGRLAMLSADQADRMEEALAIVSAYARACYENGYSAGSSLIGRLASGEMHPSDFAAKREGIRKETG